MRHGKCRPTACSSRSATTRTRRSSSTSSTTTRRDTSSRNPARPRPTSAACSPPATCRTTRIARQSRLRAPAVWPRSTPSGSSHRSKVIPARLSPRTDSVGAVPEWIDLIDPSAGDLHRVLPEHVHQVALDILEAPHVHDDEPRPRIESHGDYVLGVFLVPVPVPKEDRLYYQELDFIATSTTLVTVSKTPPGEKPFDPKPAKEACRTHEEVGMYVYHLVDDIAERYLDLLDTLDDEIDELEDNVPRETPQAVGKRLRELREDVRGIRRTLLPTRDAIRQVIDNRVELDGAELFPRDVEIAFGDSYDKLLRAS